MDVTTSANSYCNGSVNYNTASYHHLLDSAFYIDNFLIIYNILLASIGIPINVSVIGAIVVLRRPHLTRNFAWIGIGISNIFSLVTVMAVGVSVRWESSAPTHALCNLFVPLSIATQILNFMLAKVERHIAITYPNLHKSHAIPIIITAVQFGCSLLVVVMGLVFNFKLFEEFVSQIFISTWTFKLVGSIILGFLPLCLTCQVIVGTRTRILSIEINYPGNATVELGNLRDVSPVEQDNVDDLAKTRNNELAEQRSYFVRIGNNVVSRLELGAARTVDIMTAIYLLFVMTPVFTSFVVVSICLLLSSSLPYDCSPFIGGFYYTGGILNSLHSGIVNPVAFVIVSKRFYDNFFKS